MRILAILVSPFIGTLLVANVLNLIDLWGLIGFYTFHEYIIIYCFAIIIQIIYVELVFLFLKKTFDNYLIISYITCTAIGIFSYSIMQFEKNLKIENAIGIFLFFFIYSIGNALTYNIFYFKNQKNSQQ
jgi:CDP-diglyceride synthetase